MNDFSGYDMFEKNQGYWTRVFIQTTALLEQKKELTAETAYWLARDIVDQQHEPQRKLFRIAPPIRPLQTVIAGH